MHQKCITFLSYSAFLQLMKYTSKLVELSDKCGRTPLHLACRNGHIKIVQVYKDHSYLKSIRECQDTEGNTPLHLACFGGNAGIVKLLISNKANTVATNKLNEMPLHIAVQCGHVPTAHLLLKNEVPIKCTTVAGHTPLHCAAKKNNTEMITLLVKRYVLMLYDGLVWLLEMWKYIYSHKANNTICSPFHTLWTHTQWCRSQCQRQRPLYSYSYCCYAAACGCFPLPDEIHSSSCTSCCYLCHFWCEKQKRYYFEGMIDKKVMIGNLLV